jgi:hypothetical protein
MLLLLLYRLLQSSLRTSVGAQILNIMRLPAMISIPRKRALVTYLSCGSYVLAVGRSSRNEMYTFWERVCVCVSE